ncbi:MAG: DUF4418 family protein [Lachnospiraceae bacterium]|nr:DUF4418 family protein [Lachnospiraceae bacterium]
MKNKLAATISFIVLGILTILGPTVIFPVCKEVMACTYTKKAEIGLGILLILIGVVAFFFEEKVRLGLYISVVGIGALIAAAPLGWIGVCGNDMMRCRMATRPFLVVLGIIIIVVDVILIVLATRKKVESDN